MEHTTTATPPQSTTSPVLLIVFWLYVGIPLALGIWETLLKAGALFK
ncbi:oxalate:formate antiporter [Pusillimonas sp. SM2304]|nr:oxalate:formate antiporter [Pusillimonas sp. SM2304]MDS1140598.1 oxalate:formate antiporter [Pusillimonas sp. SM2304]